MTTETMSIHKLLAELKTLDDRILKTIKDGVFCVANEHMNTKIAGKPIDEYEKTMLSAYNRSVDLIRRRKALRKALMLSNVSTHVQIAGTDYTVAEAIEMRNHGIEMEQVLLNTMTSQYAAVCKRVEKENADVMEEAEQHVLALFTNKEGKVAADDIAKIKQTYIEAHHYDMINPLKVDEKIQAMSDEIEAFMSEVDAALSTSNALTMVTVEY